MFLSKNIGLNIYGIGNFEFLSIISFEILKFFHRFQWYYNSEKNCTLRCNNWIFKIIYWLLGFIIYQFMLLFLIKAGDVERNPGPFLSVVQFNINGLKMIEKKEELNCYLEKSKPHIVLLQETHLVNDDIIKFNNYSIFRSDRKIPRRRGGVIRGGGVAILVRDSLDMEGVLSIVPENKIYQDENDITELIQISIIWNGKRICFNNFYIPPVISGDNSDDDRVQTFNPDIIFSNCLLNDVLADHLFCGDFNSHHNAWNYNYLHNDSIGNEIYEWCCTNSYMIMNDPTKMTFRAISSPDITICSDNLFLKDWKIFDNNLGSDHSVITYKINIANQTGERVLKRIHSRHTTYSWKKVDWEKFNFDISSYLLFHSFGSIDDFFTCYNQFICAFHYASRNLPRGCRRDPTPWWDKEIDNAIMEREFYRELLELNQYDDDMINNYRRCIINVRVLISKKRNESWREFASGLNYLTNSTKVMKAIRRIRRDKPPAKNLSLYDCNGNLLSSCKEKSNAFLNVFAINSCGVRRGEVKNIGKRMRSVRSIYRRDKKMITKYSMEVLEDDLNTHSALFSIQELNDQLKSLSNNTACGLDNIYNEMLKSLNDENKGILLKLFNISWKNGVLHSSWSKSRIIPIFKVGKKIDSINSYRPISLTSCVAKLMERLICKRMRWILERNGEIPDTQSGFRTCRSTNDTLFRIVNDIQMGFNSGKGGTSTPHKRTVAGLIDFSRAFDRVDHHLLFKKMKKMNIPPRYIKWFIGFLRNRKCKVSVENCYSNFVHFDCGVPQGSVSGPLLFIIFMVSLQNNLNKYGKDLKFGIFADDLTVWSSNVNVNNGIGVVQNGLDIIMNWSICNNMVINIEKCEGIIFTQSNIDKYNYSNINPNVLKLNINGIDIDWCRCVKLLGILFDSSLTFGDHINKVKRESSWRLRQLSLVCGSDWGGSAKSLRAIYISYVLSLILYGSSVWWPCISISNGEKIDKLHYLACRIITGCVKSTTIESLLLEANLIPLQYEMIIRLLISVERYRRFHVDESLSVLAYSILPKLIKKKQCWQHLSERLFNSLNITTGREWIGSNFISNNNTVEIFRREKLLFYSLIPPWDSNGLDRIIINAYCFNVINDYVDEVEWKKHSSLYSIHKCEERYGSFDIEVWTDGSVSQNHNYSGIGAYKIINNIMNITYGNSFGTGNFNSSYRAELYSIYKAILHLVNLELTNCNNIIFYTDSQSVLSALLNGGPYNQKYRLESIIWFNLQLLSNLCSGYIVLQFIYSHCGILRNEEVDNLARNGHNNVTIMEQNNIHLSLVQIKTGIKRIVKNYWLENIINNGHCYTNSERFKFCSNRWSNINLSVDVSRLKYVNGCRLRCGEIISAGKFRCRLTGNSICRWCHNADETIYHIFFECSYFVVMRDVYPIVFDDFINNISKVINYYNMCLARLPILDVGIRLLNDDDDDER